MNSEQEREARLRSVRALNLSKKMMAIPPWWRAGAMCALLAALLAFGGIVENGALIHLPLLGFAGFTLGALPMVLLEAMGAGVAGTALYRWLRIDHLPAACEKASALWFLLPLLSPFALPVGERLALYALVTSMLAARREFLGVGLLLAVVASALSPWGMLGLPAWWGAYGRERYWRAGGKGGLLALVSLVVLVGGLWLHELDAGALFTGSTEMWSTAAEDFQALLQVAAGTGEQETLVTGALVVLVGVAVVLERRTLGAAEWCLLAVVILLALSTGSVVAVVFAWPLWTRVGSRLQQAWPEVTASPYLWAALAIGLVLL